MNDTAAAAWLQANQQALAAEFARLRARLRALLPGDAASRTASGTTRATTGDPNRPAPGATAATGTTAARPATAVPPLDPPPAFERIAQAFGLSPFERDVLLLAAGVEMDASLAGMVAAAQTARHGAPSFALAMGLLDGAHWSALAPQGPLRRWRLVELDPSLQLAQAALRIDERVLHSLAGIDEIDARLRPLLQPLPLPGLQSRTHASLAASLGADLDRLREASPCVMLHGDDADGQADLAAVVAASLGLSACRLSAGDIPSQPADNELLATLWQREAALGGVALYVDAHGTGAQAGSQAGSPTGSPSTSQSGAGTASTDAGTLARWIAHLQGTLVFIGTDQPIPGLDVLPVRIDKPSAEEQLALWRHALGSATEGAHASLPSVAANYRLSARAIVQRGRSLVEGQSLQQQCRLLSRPALDGLARRVESTARWEDLVLPEAQMKTLRLIASQLQHRLTVHEDWGFGGAGQRGLGLSALFFGDSGVGKTMACEVIARELELDLYRIDLSAVVSKYIGETEKNLGRVFDAAEDCGAILLFDEADALFGKRSEVKDSHDRYANIEVSYLLQRMETYRGLAVLTTNQRAALDPAFLRRLRFVVQFPFPDAAQRERIWARVFPPAMPRTALDLGKLARLPMAGGNIRNIALNAAFFAAADASPVRMAHLAQAAHLEASKQERPLAEVQTRGWE